MARSVPVLCLIALFTGGCHSVSIREPLGNDEPNVYKSLAGTWTNEDRQVIQVHVSKRGQLFAGSLEWEDATEKFTSETINIRATTAGNLRFIQAKGVDPKSADGRFAFGRYEIDDGKSVRIYWPNTAIFEEAVNAGKLKGTVVKKQFDTDVRLDETSTAILAFITKTGVDACFVKEPFTFNLLRGPD